MMRWPCKLTLYLDPLKLQNIAKKIFRGGSNDDRLRQIENWESSSPAFCHKHFRFIQENVHSWSVCNNVRGVTNSRSFIPLMANRSFTTNQWYILPVVVGQTINKWDPPLFLYCLVFMGLCVCARILNHNTVKHTPRPQSWLDLPTTTLCSIKQQI